MKEKKPFVANKNHFYIFFGLLLCLISIIFCLNDRFVARVPSTPFVYAFGSLSYLIYAAINLLGLRLIFAKKFFKIKINVYILGALLLVVAGIIFYTHFVTLNSLNGKFLAMANNEEKGTVNFFDSFNSVFANSYNNSKDAANVPHFLSLLSYPFAGGIVGYFLVGGCNALFGINNGGFIIAIVICGFAILLFF